MSIYLQDFVRAIVNDGVARRRAPVAGHEHAAGKLKRQDGCRFRRNEGLIANHRRPLGRHMEQTFAPQQRRKILTRARKVLVERHGQLIHYSPVRWR